ncbi:MAG TPA: thiamine phosphate synthase [Ktedonobacteraceae bacterium]|nr:thiamine phosphate synthase [Ktedonobacteraceae bacterium]
MSKVKLPHPVLALITEPAMPDLVTRIADALAAGVNMVQLRGHQLPARELYTLATTIQPLCQRHRAVFIVNDRLDVGLAAGADGFQLGSRSLPLPIARRLAGENSLLGASVHSSDEARHAVENGADFLLVGTIYPSHAHPNEPASGPQRVREIRQILPSSPIIAIGGISAANARVVMEAGADGIGATSAILLAPDIEQAVTAIHVAIISGLAAQKAQDFHE